MRTRTWHPVVTGAWMAAAPRAGNDGRCWPRCRTGVSSPAMRSWWQRACRLAAAGAGLDRLAHGIVPGGDIHQGLPGWPDRGRGATSGLRRTP